MSEPRPQRSKKPTKFFDDIDDDARSPEGGCPPSPNLDCQPLPPTTTTLKAKGGRPRKSTAPRIKPTSEDESQSPPGIPTALSHPLVYVSLTTTYCRRTITSTTHEEIEIEQTTTTAAPTTPATVISSST